MPIPIGEGVLIATVLGMLAKEGIAFGLLRRREKNGNGRPGIAAECRERRREIDENSLVIKHLCASMEKREEKDEKFRGKIFDKLDELKD